MNEYCKICERVPFGDIVMLGFGVWRHSTCAIGSEEWKLYYERLPRSSQKQLADLQQCYEGSNNLLEEKFICTS